MTEQRTEGSGPEEIRKAVEERRAQEAAGRDEDGKSEPAVSSALIERCLYSCDYGDGILYAAVNQDRFLYNNQAGTWLRWAGHHWEEDILADFLEEFCVIDEFAKVKATEIYKAFSEWFEENISGKGMTQRSFGTLMGKRFERKKVQGIQHYVWIGLKYDDGSGSADEQDGLFRED